MENAIMNDESTGQERVEKAKARIDDYVARIGEDQMQADQADKQVEEPIEIVMKKRAIQKNESVRIKIHGLKQMNKKLNTLTTDNATWTIKMTNNGMTYSDTHIGTPWPTNVFRKDEEHRTARFFSCFLKKLETS